MVNHWSLLVCHQRQEKQGMVMRAVREGLRRHGVGSTMMTTDPVPRSPFMCAGQMWAVERAVPRAMELGTPFWMIDNGYYMQSGKGRHSTGHWEFTYRGLVPILMRSPTTSRFPASQHLRPW